MVPVNATIQQNKFQLYPIYAVDLTINEKRDLPLYIHNSYPETLIVEDIYTTHPDLLLKWPTITDSRNPHKKEDLSEPQSTASLKIEPHSK